jgi:superfamily I DNA and/or RNA helicase
VLAATCQIAAPRDEPEPEDLYDLVIVDEAARAGIDVLIPMGLGRQVVLVGDHEQLPPHIEEEVAAKMEQGILEAAPPDESLFKWLWERLPDTHRIALDRQYRMHEDIGRVVSAVFYEPRLELQHHYAGALAAQRAPCFGLLNDHALAWVDTSAVMHDAEERRRHDVRWPAEEENAYEVALILELLRRADRSALKELRETLGTSEVIGVIPFYQNQVDAMTRGLASLETELRSMVRCGTVDSFQGMEFPLVILSCVKINKEGRIGFLRRSQRVNVAISRGQRQVVVVGDAATLGRDPNTPLGKVLALLRARDGAVVSGREVLP